MNRPYVGLVHRIDQYTSGVILLVCSPGALRPFQALFRAHQVERSYVAVVEGIIEPERGTIDLPLVRRPRRRAPRDRAFNGRRCACDHTLRADRAIRRNGCPGDLPSRNRSDTSNSHPPGKSGHPVVGEPVYRSRTAPPFPVPFPRQALHARALGFVHPMTGKEVRVEAPAPDDLSELIATLRQRYTSRSPGQGLAVESDGRSQ